MKIIRLPTGQSAPPDADCISIESHPEDGVTLMGTAMCGDDSVALTGVQVDTREAAEEQGIAWAESQGVETLYIAVDAPMTPGD
ncbi:hypothetical protein [Sphingomonas jatrophae]|uniref:Uncharacterized protein n=1 Tax=Sphingomonas jatrophae TaxID=1166337 RepID=A0A1I6JXF0_9SPHN|nr:hypothetical protein [Sphingomonas jatrophae]SFR83626.1 hypothetical protein SAMN05192580_1034 [Sphingomonas jatrophae]